MVLAGVARAFSDDIAIDLGTANTLVHVVGRGVIIDEPSVVAVLARGAARDVLAVGLRAKAMQTRPPPEPVEVIRPMRDGVIADFIATEEMLRHFITRAKTMLGFRRLASSSASRPAPRRWSGEPSTRRPCRPARAAFTCWRSPWPRRWARAFPSMGDAPSWWWTSAAAPPTLPCWRRATWCRHARCGWRATP